MLEESFEFLIGEALAQPTVFVHRDYHSRNLMWLSERNPGMIDFQDALSGPVGYDLVSLLKDCYIDWPRERVEHWVSQYRARLRASPALTGSDEHRFLRWFDLIGVQRHIKVLGIFARLWYRDGKHGYLGDLPRTLGYVRDTALRYRGAVALAHWLQRRVRPAFAAANAAHAGRGASREHRARHGAGRGPRRAHAPADRSVPKPLLTVRGKPLIVYHLEGFAPGSETGGDQPRVAWRPDPCRAGRWARWRLRFITARREGGAGDRRWHLPGCRGWARSRSWW